MDTDIDIETDKEIYVYTSIRFSGCGVACVPSEAKASECLFQSSNIPEFQLVLASCSLSTIVLEPTPKPLNPKPPKTVNPDTPSPATPNPPLIKPRQSLLLPGGSGTYYLVDF